MHDGRIAYFEDNVALAEAMVDTIPMFSNNRHRVVAQAADLSGSLAVLEQIASGEVDANIILSDGNLSGGVGGADAKLIRERVTELGLDVRMVILSSQSAEEIGVRVDAEINKKEAIASKIIEVLDGLDEL